MGGSASTLKLFKVSFCLMLKPLCPIRWTVCTYSCHLCYYGVLEVAFEKVNIVTNDQYGRKAVISDLLPGSKYYKCMCITQQRNRLALYGVLVCWGAPHWVSLVGGHGPLAPLLPTPTPGLYTSMTSPLLCLYNFKHNYYYK